MYLTLYYKRAYTHTHTYIYIYIYIYIQTHEIPSSKLPSCLQNLICLKPIRMPNTFIEIRISKSVGVGVCCRRLGAITYSSTSSERPRNTPGATVPKEVLDIFLKTGGNCQRASWNVGSSHQKVDQKCLVTLVLPPDKRIQTLERQGSYSILRDPRSANEPSDSALAWSEDPERLLQRH